MRALGLTLFVLGAVLLMGPVAFFFWAHQMYSVGMSIDGFTVITVWLVLSIAMIVGGAIALNRSRHPRDAGNRDV